MTKSNLPRQLCGSLVIAVGLLDIAFKRMNGEVHFAQPNSLCDAFNTVNADVSGVTIFLVVANERCTLDKHSTGSACRIQDAPVKGLDNLNDEFDERGWREELPRRVAPRSWRNYRGSTHKPFRKRLLQCP